ncbi:MAG TPA: flagellar hook-associated protein FlgL [Atribacteraceae bacterium]|nr:flagellar hook-associated protein FlgL [Atribacteraceae bacterium]
MRVTQKILTDRVMGNLNQILRRLVRVQDELSSGRSVLAPSDSPVRINQILNLRTSITRLDQYRTNIEDSINWLNLVDRSLESAIYVNQTVNTIALQAANGTLTSSDRDILASQVERYLEEMVGNGNISFAGKYLFSGTQTLSRPFSLPSGTPEDRRIRTGQALHMAIQGGGYFQLVKFNDAGYQEIFYTRDGSFEIQWYENELAQTVGRIVNRDGIPLLVTQDGTVGTGALVLPRDYKTIEIGQNGTVTVTRSDNTQDTYQIQLARFREVFALTEAGPGLFRKSDRYTGTPIVDHPMVSGLGTLYSGYRETTAKISYHGNAGRITHEVESGTTMAVGFPGDEILFRGFEAGGSERPVIRNEELAFTVNGREVIIDNTGGSLTKIQSLVNRLNMEFNADMQLRHEIYAATDGQRILLRSRTEDVLEFKEITGTPLQDWGIVGYSRIGSGEISVFPSGGEEIIVNGKTLILDASPDVNTLLADLVNKLAADPDLSGRVFAGWNTAGNGIELYTNDGSALVLADGAGGLLTTWGMLNSNGFVVPGNSSPVILEAREAEGALKILRDMEHYLRTNDFAKISSSALGRLRETLDTLIKARSQAGARTLRMETHLTRFDDFSVNFKRLLSHNEDIDVAAVAMRLKEHENVYQMALAAAARAIQPTLLNFLR